LKVLGGGEIQKKKPRGDQQKGREFIGLGEQK